MLRLKLYLSSATRKLDDRDLREILEISRSRNGEAGVTGMLLFHDGNFLQLLEGEADAVEQTWGRIKNDPRHRGILVMLDEARETRLFPDWSMGFRKTAAGECIPGWSDFLEGGDEPKRHLGDRALSLLGSFRENLR